MKLRLSVMKSYFVNHLVSKGIADIDTANYILDEIITLSENNLLCYNCKNVLPDEMFHASKANPARRNRLTICRSCHKALYR